MHFSLIIPTLNERESIDGLFEGLSKAANELAPAHELEVVMVDDGSKDGTVEYAKSKQVPFSLKTVQRNERGLATAVLRGFSEASGDIWGVMDADQSHPMDMVPVLARASLDADVVVGSRNIQGGMVEEWPWYRYLLSRSATWLVYLLGVNSTDPMSGFFFLKPAVLQNSELSPIGYKILLEILVKGKYEKYHEVAYVFRNREVGKSKMGMKEGINYLRHYGRLLKWKLFNR